MCTPHNIQTNNFDYTVTSTTCNRGTLQVVTVHDQKYTLSVLMCCMCVLCCVVRSYKFTVASFKLTGYKSFHFSVTIVILVQCIAIVHAHDPWVVKAILKYSLERLAQARSTIFYHVIRLQCAWCPLSGSWLLYMQM